ncbi:hypothetical protein T01_1468 [Trichinella spiralis]|uniref:Uncharacterized protein n=1 Tax=Trichinella spiralis TaxID=6334 RepID=A0A0V1BJS7_TRISP|nr:hypothetical protein T01_1468 [Trichinella spiralis]
MEDVLKGRLTSVISFIQNGKSRYATLQNNHFVLNVASVSIEFAPDGSCIVQCTHFIHDSITLTSSEYGNSSDGALTVPVYLCLSRIVSFINSWKMRVLHITSLSELFSFLSLWTPCLVMFTSVCSRCGITNILGYVKRAHFIHDSITLTSSEFDVSSDGPLSTSDAEEEGILFAADGTLKLRLIRIIVFNVLLEDANVTWIELDNIYNDR